MTEQDTSNYIELAANIVSAFVSKNCIQSTELPSLISTVHEALQSAREPASAKQEAEKPAPAVPIKKSITPDYLISLEDGKPYRSLKRHLHARGLTPQLYRERYGLPRNYPMVAPNYSARRSELAKSMGLGQVRRGAAVKAGKNSASRASTKAPAKRSRKRVA
jgi:predicted transcriptional regulator